MPQLDERATRDLRLMTQRAPHAEARWHGERVIWVETITTKLGDQYRLAFYYDPAISDYRARVLEPKLEGLYSVVEGHLFPDGTICLRGDSDPRFANVSEARARAVLWCLSFGVYRRSGVFPMRTVHQT